MVGVGSMVVSDQNPFHFVQRYRVVRSIVKARGSGTRMSRHMLSPLKSAAVHHVRRDSGCPHGMIADGCSQLSIPSPAFDHAECILPQHPVFGQVATAVERAKQWHVLLAVQITCVDVGQNRFLSRVMERHFVLSPALFFEADEISATVEVDVTDIDSDRSSDPCKCVEHERDESPVSEAADRVGRNRIQQVPGIRWLQHRRFTFHDDVFRTSHRRCGICIENPARHEVVEKHPNGSQMLLHGRSAVFPAKLFDVKSHQRWLSLPQRQFSLFAPMAESCDRMQIGGARVWIGNVGSEKLDKPPFCVRTFVFD